jgi:hypothetical protein
VDEQQVIEEFSPVFGGAGDTQTGEIGARNPISWPHNKPFHIDGYIVAVLDLICRAMVDN